MDTASHTSNLLEQFGDRLRSVREANGLSQQQLGDRVAGSPDPTIVARWEAGRVLPPLAVMHALDHVLGFDQDTKNLWRRAMSQHLAERNGLA
ncbi:MAG: helix-turn-helix transcriptional regulator [Thermoleophilia bacterium]